MYRFILISLLTSVGGCGIDSAPMPPTVTVSCRLADSGPLANTWIVQGRFTGSAADIMLRPDCIAAGGELLVEVTEGAP